MVDLDMYINVYPTTDGSYVYGKPLTDMNSKFMSSVIITAYRIRCRRK